MPRNLLVADGNTAAAIEATKEKTSGFASAALANKRLRTIAGHLRPVSLNETKQTGVAPAPAASTLNAAVSRAARGTTISVAPRTDLLEIKDIASIIKIAATEDVAEFVMGVANNLISEGLQKARKNAEEERNIVDKAFINSNTHEEQEALRTFENTMLAQRELIASRNR